MNWIQWGLTLSVIMNIVQVILHGRSLKKKENENLEELDKQTKRYHDLQTKHIEMTSNLRNEHELTKSKLVLADATIATAKDTINEYATQSVKDTNRILELAGELADCRKEIDQQRLLLEQVVDKADGLIAMVDDSEDDVMDLPVEPAPATPQELKAISKPKAPRKRYPKKKSH